MPARLGYHFYLNLSLVQLSDHSHFPENEKTCRSTHPSVLLVCVCHTCVTAGPRHPHGMLSLLLTGILHYRLETSMAGIICFSFSLKAFANMLGG